MSIATKSAITTATLQALGRVEPSTPARFSADGGPSTTPGTGRVDAAGEAGADRAGWPAALAPSSDSRYVRFVQAIQVLRMEPGLAPPFDAPVPDGPEVSLVDDGLPRPVPPPVVPPLAESEAILWADDVYDRGEAEAGDSDRVDDARPESFGAEDGGEDIDPLAGLSGADEAAEGDGDSDDAAERPELARVEDESGPSPAHDPEGPGEDAEEPAPKPSGEADR